MAKMIQQGLIASAVEIGSVLQILAAKCRILGAQQLPSAEERVVEINNEILDRDIISWSIRLIERSCEQLSLHVSRLQAFTLETWVRHGHTGTFSELAGRLDSLLGAIMDEAVFRYVFAIPVDLTIYLRQEKPFGGDVWNAFPSSRADVQEACYCIAYGRNSAAVYHAMCALEPAMKALARNVRAPWSPKSGWHNALVEIEKRIKAIASGSQTKRQPARIVFLSQAASEFRYFKDGWRNATMHARYKASDSQDAERVLTHVKTFMVLLSSRVRESGRRRAK